MNVVIIVSDTFRWDYLGAYGNAWIQTPRLDALAAESGLFLDAYTEALPTIPARRVIMTGRNCFPFDYRPQLSDQVQLHGWHPLYDEDVTLAEHLNKAGYCTAFFNDVYHMMKPGKNFHRGFEQWQWIRGQEGDAYAPLDRARVKELAEAASYGRDLRDTAWVVRHLNLREQWQSDADTLVAQTMTRAATWVREYSLKRPFYLHVECFDPHEPWDPPADYATRYEPDYGHSLDGLIPPGTTENMTERQLANVRAAYAGEVTLVDHWIGHLLDALRDSGRLDDTLVVFTSDHGAMLGEQMELHKGQDRLRNQCTRLPLLIRHPRGDKAGARINGFCQHQDIMPTVLGILGEGTPGRVLGRNVWPRGGVIDDAPDYIVSGFGFFACCRTAQWNYVRRWSEGGEASGEVSLRSEQLYNLSNDPRELTNVVAQHRDIADALGRKLAEHIKRFAPLTGGSFQGVAAEGDHLSFDALPRADA